MAGGTTFTDAGVRSSESDAGARAHGDERTARSAGELKRATVATLFERTVSSHALTVEPGTALPHRGTPPRTLEPGDVDRFVAAVLSADDSSAIDYVRRAQAAGVGLEAIYLDLLTPAAARLGEMWEADDCDFVAVTIALGRMQRSLRDVSRVFVATTDQQLATGSALLTCVAGEQHTLGIVMIADYLIRDGWRIQVGSPWTDSDLATIVRSESFDVLGFSLACEGRITQLRRQIGVLRRASRNPAIKVLVGGQAFVGRPDLLKRVDADGFAETVRDIVPVARKLLAASRG